MFENKSILEITSLIKSKEILDLDFDKKEYSKNKNEVKQRWRKQLKFSTLDIALLKLGDSLENINDRVYNESLAIVKKNTEDFFEFYMLNLNLIFLAL